MAHTLSHRQFTTWLSWIRFQWNHPNRTDKYIMQLTAFVRSYMESKQIDVDQCKMAYTFSYRTDDPPATEEPKGYHPTYRSEAELRTMAIMGVTW